MAPAAQAQIVFGNEQLGTLQLYGKLYPQFGYGTSKDPTQPTSTEVSTLVKGAAATCGTACTTTSPGARRAIDVQNSYIGFRGERDIAPSGLKFIWQIEQSINFDTGVSTTSWSTRNSFLGVRTRFGTVKLGNMDTIYKEYGDTMMMFGIASGNFISASNVLSHIGLGNNNNARFHERAPNSIQFESPQFAGFTAGYQYSPDEARVTSGGGTDASLHSYGVKWDTQRFYLSVHQELHNDRFGGSSNVGLATMSNIGTAGAHSRDTGTRVSGEWRFTENQRFVVDISRLRYRERGQAAGVKFEAYNHNTWGIGWDGGFGGPLRLAVQLLRGQEGNCSVTGGIGCSTAGLTGTMLNAGVRWRFDRQTFVYVIGSKLQNGPSARYDNWSAADPARGADVLQGAIGLSYTF
jgi:predicted porin